MEWGRGGGWGHCQLLCLSVCADFPLDRVPVVLSPLLYRGQSDITEDRLVSTNISQPSSTVRIGGRGAVRGGGQ